MIAKKIYKEVNRNIKVKTMLEERFTSHSEQETEAIAAKVAPHLKNRDVLCLYGDLGAGKTSFSRALIRALTQSDIDVPSPTFTLVQTYEHDSPIWHFDLYRLEEPEEIYEIGWEEALSDGISLIEWPQRIEAFLPKNRIDMHINITDKDVREFLFKRIGPENE